MLAHPPLHSVCFRTRLANAGDRIMDLFQEYNAVMTRRHLFKRGALGLGTAALATLMPDRLLAIPEERQATGGLPGLPHFAPKAKRAIYLFMNGGPAQMDLFDYKPRMDSYFDRDLPNSIRRGQRLTTMSSGQPRFPIAPSKFRFARHGRAGTYVSELLPYTARMVDDLCVIKTMHTEAINHDPAVTYIFRGSRNPG